MGSIVVHPKLIDDILINPNMGIATFQRFNGDPLYPTKRWSEYGPEEFPHAGDPPAESWPAVDGYPETSIAYCRWYWATLSPEPEVIRFEIIENACRSAAARGQTLDLRIMPHNGTNTVPEWYKAIGRGHPAEKPDYPRWLPDYEDPLYLEHFGGLVRALGERFDGDPRINMIDLAMFGHWGEWHRRDRVMGPVDLRLQGVDLFLSAWPRTPKAMLIGGREALAHAVARGCGWRADSWGDMGLWSDQPGQPHSKWNHMVDSYPEALCRSGVQHEAWKNGPVSFEPGRAMDDNLERGFDMDYIVDQTLRWHATSISLKSIRLPEPYWGHIRYLQKHIGYRIALRRCEYPAEVQAGSRFRIITTWENRGVAPPYHGYPAAVQLTGNGSAQEWTIAESTKAWLPGYVHIESDLEAPDHLAPGRYRLRVALLSPHTGKPIVKLASEGRGDDGWHEVGEVQVQHTVRTPSR